MSRKRASSPTGAADNSPRSAQKHAAVSSSANGGPSRMRQEVDEDEMGEFEDQWEDEYEDEDVEERDDDDSDEDEDGEESHGIVKRRGGDRELGIEGKVDSMDLIEEEERSPSPEAYLPSAPLPADTQLVADLTTYNHLHSFQLSWPALSFDVLRDGYGEERRSYPADVSLIAGTQSADQGRGTASATDEVVIMRWEGLSKTSKRDMDEDSDAGSDDSHSTTSTVDADPVLTYRTIPHVGCVNRLRASPLPHPLSAAPPLPPAPYHAATFSETGSVHIFDIAPHLASLHQPSNPDYAASSLPKRPVHTIKAHGRAEGFALSWGPAIGAGAAGGVRLLSGDVHSKIHLTTLGSSGWTTVTSASSAFASHTSSVEDLSWSPTEPTVFGSCSADKSVKVWDVRVKERKSVISVDGAHDSDVNVLSWNHGTTYLLLTGGDEGGLKVWDLRNFKSAKSGTPTPVASFSWHRAPITSVEWHPTEDSCFAAAGADDQVTLWDLSVEVDDEERSGVSKGKGVKDVPPQLLFVHQGQNDIKELHWHPQIPGTVISTAVTGFDCFKTISV